MPSLYEYTDGYEAPEVVDKPALPVAETGFTGVVDKLFGLNGQERYQLWPEKLVREAISAPHDAVTQGLPLPGLRREDVTDVPAPTSPTKDSTALGKMLGIAPVAWEPNDKAIEQAQAVSALAGTGGLAGAGKEAGMSLGIVPVDVAKKLNFKSSKPSDLLKAVAENTEGASIDADGHLIVNMVRHQGADQEMAESVRGGVFYLPKGDKNARHYNGTTGNNYGGQQRIEGETAFVNPLLVKGATGGKAPETAYNTLMGDKKAYQALEADVSKAAFGPKHMKEELVDQFLEKHAPEMRDYASYIIANSSKGNQLRYALSEAAIASAARRAGHDGIVGYSELRGADKGKQRLSEIYDVRENRYPSPSGDYSIHPDLMSDSSKPGTAIQAMANTNKPFYSAVENALTAAKQPKADAQQWLSFLKNQPGVKQEELSHLGLDKLSGSISKDDLLKAVQEGQPQIKELVSHGEAGHPRLKEILELDTQARKLEASGDKNGAAELREKIKAIPPDGDFNPRYKSYQLPGGENYREMLLTLPKTEQGLVAKPEGVKGAWNVYDKSGNRIAENLNPSMNEKEAIAFSTRHSNDQYKSSHWDEPNVLAHIRMNDRTIDGKKSLHLEEIQSDWHQEGRKKGYKDNDKINSLQKEVDDINKNFKPLKELPEGYELIKDGDKWGITPPGQIHARPFAGQWPNKEAAIKSALDKINETNLIKSRDEINSKLIEAKAGIPDAPFKKTWDELALKKAITEAVKNGYDQISWTPGEAQAARYDLSKDVSKVYLNNPVWHGENDIRGNLIVTSKANGNDLISKPVKSLKEIEDLIGKEAADRLVNKPSSMQGRDHVLSGDGLKIGGQGMKAFYDKMLVDKANALVKKHGGKVEQKEIPTKADDIRKSVDDRYSIVGDGRMFNTREEALKAASQPVHVLKITPELREHVLKKGFPLFSAGVPIFSPVSHDPFKVTPVDHNPFEDKTK